MSKIQKIPFGHSGFPEKLAVIPSPPKSIYVIGNLKVLNKNPSLAIVGSRKASAYGQLVTKDLAQAAARAGAVIVSGLAFGIDSIAHKTALSLSTETIAVLPCGLNNVYPQAHSQLAAQIVNGGGALISEYPTGTPPLRQHFIARNRLVSGLGDATLITEAAAKSGTIHTANFTLEQGKTVMAVPGNINSPNSQGTNKLIRSGAAPITCPDDMFFELGIDSSTGQTEIIPLNEQQAIIISAIKSGITDAAVLLTESGLEAKTFNQTLSMLEISGAIRPLGGGHWGLG